MTETDSCYEGQYRNMHFSDQGCQIFREKMRQIGCVEILRATERKKHCQLFRWLDSSHIFVPRAQLRICLQIIPYKLEIALLLALFVLLPLAPLPIFAPKHNHWTAQSVSNQAPKEMKKLKSEHHFLFLHTWTVFVCMVPCRNRSKDGFKLKSKPQSWIVENRDYTSDISEGISEDLHRVLKNVHHGALENC